MSIRAPLQLWRDVEMFQAFHLDEVLTIEDHAWHISLAEPLYSDVPWRTPLMWGLNPDYNYSFDLFLGIFERSETINIIGELHSITDVPDDFDDARNTGGITCVLRIALSNIGDINIDDSRISTLPWALTSIRRGTPLSLEGFDAYGRDLLMRIISHRSVKATEETSDEVPEYTPLNWQELRLINQEAKRELTLEWRNFAERIVIVAHRLGKKRPVLDTKAGEQRISKMGEDVSTIPFEEDLVSVKILTSDLEKNHQKERSSSNMQPRIRRRCDILNSFFLRDLQKVALKVSDLSKNSPLMHYLQAKSHPSRIDVTSPSSRLWSSLAPQALPLGRWPHDPLHYNALMQQVAVNEFTSLRHPLFAVNGPPGTGKTTLIKDIIAANVVQRALKLVRYRSPDEAFEKKIISTEVDRTRFTIRKLKRDLIGFELVIASSNNNAVENITRELPKRSGLGADFARASYMHEVANLYEIIRTGGIAQQGTEKYEALWGMISAPLGNRKNREIFSDALLFGPREENDQKTERVKEGNVLSLHEWRRRVPETGTLSYAKARLNFLEAHKHVEELLAQITIYPSTPPTRELNENVGSNGVACSEEYSFISQVKDKNNQFIFPTTDNFGSFPIQSRAPWLTENLNHAQSNLFIAALNLHQAWVRESAALGPNLIALGKLLSKPNSFNEDVAPFIWQTLFMIVPAISTTLASVERMWPNVGEGQFGNVIIEEAGQATPQSVAGILWRAKRALVIGDPMQIQPVVSAPEVLVRYFCSEYGVENPLFSPLASSAQTLADESNELGAYLEHSSSGSWVGSPLRVHRRCDEPMFSIANTIAYGGLMTRQEGVSSHRHAKLAHLPKSTWFDIDGDCTSKHWVPQQGSLALDIFSKLSTTFTDPKELDLFFITPFKAIKERFAKIVTERTLLMGYSKEYAKALQRRVGTVHTFQGKEADVVIFILGCDQNSLGAARWAGERPNLLNVAVTRARHRLYVVGSLALWHNQGFFSELASNLPRARDWHE